MRLTLLILLSGALASCAGQGSTAAPPLPAPAPPTATPAPIPLRAPADRGLRYTGLTVEVVTEALARASSLSRTEGLYVRAVESGSPGARAGIRPGDVLLLASGSYLGAPEALTRVLAGAPLGSSIELGVRRVGELVMARLPVEPPPGGRLMAVIRPPSSALFHLAADGGILWAYGAVPGSEERGIVPVPVPGQPPISVGPRPVASAIAERVIAADIERVYLGWAASELYIDVYEIRSGRVSRLPVRGAESLANRCRAQGLARVGSEIWMACQRPEGPVVARIDLASGQARVEPLPPTYRTGLAFDGEGVLWLCCQDASGRLSLSRTDVASGTTTVFSLPEPVISVAADPQAVYLLGGNRIYQHAPWR